MTKEPVFSDKLPAPVGPYVPAVRSKGHTFVSGQIGMDPATGKLVAGGVEKQAEQAMINFKAILEATGKGFTDVIRCCIYLTDMGDFPAVNVIYGKYMSAPFPARTCIAVAALPLGASFEIDAVMEA